MENNNIEQINTANEGGVEITKLEETKLIEEIAANEFSMKLDTEKLEEIKNSVNTTMEYGMEYSKGKDNITVASTEDLIRTQLQSIKKIKEFTNKFYAAENLYHQLNPDGVFYSLDDNNPEKLRRYISKINEHKGGEKNYFPFVAKKLRKIIDIFGAPPIEGKKAYFVAKPRSPNPKIEEVEFKSVQKNGNIIIAGKSGSISPLPRLFKTEDEAKQCIEDIKAE